MKKSPLITWIVILVALLPAAYLGIVGNELPKNVPVHFGADMKPDRIGDKDELWLVTGILAIVSIGVYFLLNNLYRIDPKQKGKPRLSIFNKLAAGIVVFISALNFIIILSAKGTMAMQNLLFPLLGLLFAFIGNYMHTIRPNYFAGLRLPWTLSSDDNWRKTHQLAGKLWFAGGMLIAVVSLFLSPTAMLPLFIVLIVVMTIIPTIYSYRLFKQHA